MTLKNRWGQGGLLMLLLISLAGTTSAASDPGGFQGLPWARSADECIKAGVCTGKILPVENALPGKEKFLIGRKAEFLGLPVRDSSLGFHEDRLYSASVFFNPQQAPYERILEALTKQHGAPKSADARGAFWQLGNTRLLLYKGQNFHGLIYSYAPEMAKVAKAKGYPQPAAATPPPAPAKKKK